MRNRFRNWLNERRPSSRTTGDKVFGSIFTLLVLGGVGYVAYWAWGVVTEIPPDFSVEERAKAQTCYEEVDVTSAQSYISSLEEGTERNILQYEWDGFSIALENDEMFTGVGRYPNSVTYCDALTEFTSMIDEVKQEEEEES